MGVFVKGVFCYGVCECGVSKVVLCRAFIFLVNVREFYFFI